MDQRRWLGGCSGRAVRIGDLRSTPWVRRGRKEETTKWNEKGVGGVSYYCSLGRDMVKRETGVGRRAKRYWRGRWRDVDSDERFLGLGDLAVAESCSFRTNVGESTKYNNESNISLLDYIFGLFLYDVCGCCQEWWNVRKKYLFHRMSMSIVFHILLDVTSHCVRIREYDSPTRRFQLTAGLGMNFLDEKYELLDLRFQFYT